MQSRRFDDHRPGHLGHSRAVGRRCQLVVNRTIVHPVVGVIRRKVDGKRVDIGRFDSFSAAWNCSRSPVSASRQAGATQGKKAWHSPWSPAAQPCHVCQLARTRSLPRVSARDQHEKQPPTVHRAAASTAASKSSAILAPREQGSANGCAERTDRRDCRELRCKLV